MDKTIKINLAGVLFQADEDAYRMLRDYLQAIDMRFRNTSGGNETIEDIEARIAEIFRSKRGPTGVILKEDVGEVISILGRPEDFDMNEPRQPGQTYSTGKRTLYRNPDGAIIGGVCGGLSAYLDFQAVWVRLIFVLFALFWGIGFFVYLGLWIALPSATSETRKRELHGNNYDQNTRSYNNNPDPYRMSGTDTTKTGSNLGNALDQVFRALGKFFFVVFRIFMIIFGIIFSVTGFTILVTTLLVFFFRSPAFLPGTLEGNFFYLPDFLDFVVSPPMSPWVLILGFIVVILPLLALIYWGIRMIFWFRAKDGIISLVALVIWVASLTALSLILANQGLSFSERGRTVSEMTIGNTPDTLFVVTGKKISDLKYDRAFKVPDENYAMYMNSETRELDITANLRLGTIPGKQFSVEVKKWASGPGKLEANRMAEAIPYNFTYSNDTLYLDQYFRLPAGHRWGANEVRVKLNVPEGTILYFDENVENMFENHININDDRYTEIEAYELGRKYWRISDDDLTRLK
ncbi:MAG: PspC domain-containing protein [Bacteroidales bacterium]